ncbi:DUF2470 domain-containing protein [Streptomyces genisteinicus]|uniref:DUF2470 domain-containing protein n=1 Tax=Streptomyces genisteinicus TaxID=2768068 RepID=A0A7H0HWR5_9ACTN|nr:DUF2470 domain-containing protein [Streptomyces genisteinicus]QNP64981.1 DUF2470 domain-containing protein [Streptomyces genisteinicus]
MRHRPARAAVPAPTAAERVRAVLATAHSLTVVSEGVRTDVHGLDGAEALGHFHLHDPDEPIGPPGTGRVPVRLELTDVSPAPVRDRMRARVTLTGLLAGPFDPASRESTCLEFGQAVLEEDGLRRYVTLAELQATPLDPVAAGEAGIVTHWLDGHGELAAVLLRLVRPRPAAGIRRVLPLGVDRHGVVLRMEYARGHRDARLPFGTPVDRIEQFGPRMQALLAAARRAAHTDRLPI